MHCFGRLDPVVRLFIIRAPVLISHFEGLAIIFQHPIQHLSSVSFLFYYYFFQYFVLSIDKK